VQHTLVIEPTISNARGYRDQVENVEDLLDVNLFAPTEMLTPGTIRGDDAIRSAIKQYFHISKNMAAVAIKLHKCGEAH